jgi:MFS family permease
MGLGGAFGAPVAGAIGSVDTERQHLTVGMLATAAGLLVVMVAPTVWLVALMMLLVGACNGPIDIGLFGLRQRRTPVEWVGRVFAVSMAFNFAGFPIGSALGGPVAGRSVQGAFAVAALAALTGAAIAWIGIPQRSEAGR